MSVYSDFEDIVTTCEFYADSDWEIHVDLENSHVTMGDYGVYPVRGDGRPVGYLVEDGDGVTQVVDDLDSYFRSELDRGVMS